MTVYRKCRPCKHRGNCGIQKALGEAVRGFGVGTLTHRCRKFEPFLKPGDNVWVRAQEGPYENDDFGGGYKPGDAEFPAHFVQFNKTNGRAIVFIQPGVKSRDGETTFEPANNQDGFCKVSYAPLRAPNHHARKGITEMRDGFTATMTCCGRPETSACAECGKAIAALSEDDLRDMRRSA